jgi:hypothetical protein
MNRQHLGANTPVQVVNFTHPRNGQAGVVAKANGPYNGPADQQEPTVLVRFDEADAAGKILEAVDLADLEKLSS